MACMFKQFTDFVFCNRDFPRQTHVLFNSFYTFCRLWWTTKETRMKRRKRKGVMSCPLPLSVPDWHSAPPAKCDSDQLLTLCLNVLWILGYFQVQSRCEVTETTFCSVPHVMEAKHRWKWVGIICVSNVQTFCEHLVIKVRKHWQGLCSSVYDLVQTVTGSRQWGVFHDRRAVQC